MDDSKGTLSSRQSRDYQRRARTHIPVALQLTHNSHSNLLVMDGGSQRPCCGPAFLTAWDASYIRLHGTWAGGESGRRDAVDSRDWLWSNNSTRPALPLCYSYLFQMYTDMAFSSPKKIPEEKVVLWLFLFLGLWVICWHGDPSLVLFLSVFLSSSIFQDGCLSFLTCMCHPCYFLLPTPSLASLTPRYFSRLLPSVPYLFSFFSNTSFDVRTSNTNGLEQFQS